MAFPEEEVLRPRSQRLRRAYEALFLELEALDIGGEAPFPGEEVLASASEAPLLRSEVV